MIQNLLAKVVGTQNERDLKRLRPIVGQVGALEPAMTALSDDQLREKTAEFQADRTRRDRDTLVEAFGGTRGGRRTLSSYCEVQVIGGRRTRAKIAEMIGRADARRQVQLPERVGRQGSTSFVNDTVPRDSGWMAGSTAPWACAAYPARLNAPRPGRVRAALT